MGNQNLWVIGWGHSEFLWSPSSDSFYYTGHPNHDPYFWQKVYYHQMGRSYDDDKIVMEDHEQKDWDYLLWEESKNIHVVRRRFSGTGGLIVEGYKKPILNQSAPLIQYYDSNQSQYSYELINIGGTEYLLTNEKADNYKLIRKKQSGKWTEVIPECDDLLIRVTGINGQLAATYLQNGHHSVHIYDKHGKKAKKVPLPDPGIVYFDNAWSSPKAKIYFTSLIQPGTIYEYDEPQNSLIFHSQEKIEGYRSGLYETKQLFVTSQDGTKVPIHIAYRKGVGRRPALLTGYGGFGVALSPSFSVEYLPWLQSAGIICLAHLRGGGEYGYKWHQQGRQENKQNVFDDFISIAEWLTETYTNPEKLAIIGRSNGGLLTGACLIQRPDLFGAVVSGVPLLDMLRYQCFRIGEIWIGEYGSSKKENQFPYLLKYSPYHNVQVGVSYPPTLFTTGVNDRRVDPMHARKMAAQLQCADSKGAPHLLAIYPNSGHVCHSLLNYYQRIANHHSFLMDHVGLQLKHQKAIPESASIRKNKFFHKIESLKINKQLLKEARKQTEFQQLQKKFNLRREFYYTKDGTG